MVSDEIISKALQYVYDASPGAAYVGDYAMEELGYDYDNYAEIVDRLEAEGLARPLDPPHRMIISDFGRRVVNEGGYLAHVQRLEKKEKANEKRQEVSDKIAKYELLNGKWLYKMRWWPLIISVVALIASVIALFK